MRKFRMRKFVCVNRKQGTVVRGKTRSPEARHRRGQGAVGGKARSLGPRHHAAWSGARHGRQERWGQCAVARGKAQSLGARHGRGQGKVVEDKARSNARHSRQMQGTVTGSKARQWEAGNLLQGTILSTDVDERRRTKLYVHVGARRI